MSNVTFNEDDLGFVAQVAHAEADRNKPQSEGLMRVYRAFDHMANRRVIATWDLVQWWLDFSQPYAVWEDILDMMVEAVEESNDE